MNPPKPNPLNPRDFVERLDALIKIRISQQVNPLEHPSLHEQAELLKRDMTDYLLDIDKRPGIYVKG